MEMQEDISGDSSDRGLGDFGKNGVAEFVKGGAGESKGKLKRNEKRRGKERERE